MTTNQSADDARLDVWPLLRSAEKGVAGLQDSPLHTGRDGFASSDIRVRGFHAAPQQVSRAGAGRHQFTIHIASGPCIPCMCVAQAIGEQQAVSALHGVHAMHAPQHHLHNLHYLHHPQRPWRRGSPECACHSAHLPPCAALSARNTPSLHGSTGSIQLKAVPPYPRPHRRIWIVPLVPAQHLLC